MGILDDWNTEVKLKGGVRKPEPSSHPDPRVNLTLADMKLPRVEDRPAESANAGQSSMYLGGLSIEEYELIQERRSEE